MSSTVIILGMHRSGTSCVTGLLQRYVASTWETISLGRRHRT